MAHIWFRSSKGQWCHQPLVGDSFWLAPTLALAASPQAANSWAENEALDPHGAGPVQELAAPLASRASTNREGARRVDTGRSGHEHVGAVQLRRVEIEGSVQWVLLCGPESRVRHNGAHVDLGLVMLRDRDELHLGRGGGDTERLFYFSTEQLVRVEPAPVGLVGKCPRCKGKIATGSNAVRCGTCGAWHHQSETHACWRYTPRCAACHQQPTLLGDQFQWIPK